MAENTLPLFLESHISWGATKFDEKFDFKTIIKNVIVGAVVEGLDRKAAEIVLSGINNLASPHVPDEYKDEIHTVLNDLVDEDDNYETAVSAVFDVLEDLKGKLSIENEIVSKSLSALLDLFEVAVNIYLESKKED